MGKYIFQSGRLGFRLWQDDDIPIFSRMNTSPDVMEYFPSILSVEQTTSMVQRIDHHFTSYSYGLFAVDHLESQNFIGYIGLQHVRFKSFFTPAIELGYRLKSEYWGKGLATEGAIKCLQYAFSTLKLQEIVSFTAVHNNKSERVMIKTGMKKTGEFDHPLINKANQLCRHVLYKLENPG